LRRADFLPGNFFEPAFINRTLSTNRNAQIIAPRPQIDTQPHISMPRANFRPGGGGRKQNGPETWDDEEPALLPLTNAPAPTFPELSFPTPRPFSPGERDGIDKYLSFRRRAREGPFHATLDPASLTDEIGRVAPRKGFDPFNDQEVWAARYAKRKRTVPDVVAGRLGPLRLFPKELWAIMDPRRSDPIWETPEAAELGKPKTRKRKRRLSANEAGGGDEGEVSDADSDAVVSGRRKRTTEQTRRGEKDAKQRRGLDAEDDYPEGEPNAEDDGEAEDEPQDSEFDESEDEDNDYNAENYFDAGDDDDMGGGGDDDDGGGGEWYS
jgi:DNA-directed RNA polymerase III subunit RPC7